MNLNSNSNVKAGWLYVLPGLAVLGIWYVLLFTANSSGTTPLSTFVFVLTEGPKPWWFAWLLLLPILCFALAVAYMTRLPKSRIGSAWLFASGVALALAAWATVSTEVALFATLPLWYGFRCVKERIENSPNGT
jgi:hypothetical protein